MKIEKDEITIRDFTETDPPLMFKWLTDKRVLEYSLIDKAYNKNLQ